MARILIVDDEEVIRGLLEAHLVRLVPGHTCDQASSAREAMGLLTAAMADGADGYDLIISDIRMPGMDGLEFLRLIMNQVESITPCIVLTGSGEVESAIRAIRVRAYDFVCKPWDMGVLAHAVARALERREDLLLRRRYQSELERRVDEARTEVTEAFAALLEGKDQTTKDHCERVRRLSELVGREMGLEGEGLQSLLLGAILHDIGKVRIPLEILNKPAKLTEQEWVVMRTHPTVGGDICDGIPMLRPASPVVRNHHEKWDGSGYPAGLRGEAIPLAARIFMVVDAFDTITSSRSYKTAQSVDEAFAEIRRCSGAHFDPAVVEVFVGLSQTIAAMTFESLATRRDAFAGRVPASPPKAVLPTSPVNALAS